jgi:hypothetical protein
MITVEHGRIPGTYVVVKDGESLSVTWTQELVDDLGTYNGVDIDEQVLSILMLEAKLTRAEAEDTLDQLKLVGKLNRELQNAMNNGVY